MYWVTVSLFIISAWAAWKFYRLWIGSGRLKFAGLSVAAGLLALMQGFLMFENQLPAPLLTVMLEWGHILSLAVILSTLAIFVRESKPDFARFPLLYTALPLFIVLTYFLISDTYALKTWLFSMYQGGAVLVGLLMYAVHAWRRESYRGVLAAAGGFTLTWFTYWFLPFPEVILAWVWQILLGASILAFVLTLEQVEAEPTAGTA